MELIEFVSLSFSQQMDELKKANLTHTFTLEDYQISLYQLHNFYVEVKRKLPDLQFEKMLTMHFEDLPTAYKSIILPGNK